MNAEEVYALLNKKIKKGGITDDKIKQIVEQYLKENPVQVITDNTLSVAGTPADALATGTAVDLLKEELNNYRTIIMNNSDSYSNCVFSNTVNSIGNVVLQSVGTSNHRITFMSRFRVSQNRKFTILVKDGYQVRCLFFKNSGDLNIGTGYKYVDSGETDLTTWHTDNRCITVPYGANGMSVCISKLDNSAILPSECKNVVVYYGGISDSEQNILLENDGNLIGLSYSKKGIFMGDSISFGFYSYLDSNGNRCNADDLYSDYTKTAAKMRISDWFSRFYNIPIDNIAERGTGYVADNRGLGNALVKARATDFSNYDFVALCFGVNDYIQSCNIGSIETKTEGTIIGNLIQVLEKIYNDNPYCKVIVFTPYNTWGQVRASKPSQTYYGNENTNYALGYSINGNTLQNIIDAINSVCTRYGIESVDLSKGNFCNRINIKNILVDGLHPTEKAMKALASEMYENMTFR